MPDGSSVGSTFMTSNNLVLRFYLFNTFFYYNNTINLNIINIIFIDVESNYALIFLCNVISLIKNVISSRYHYLNIGILLE